MIISFISIFSASMYLSPALGKLYYKQIFWYFIGFVVIILFNKISINVIYKYTFHIYVLNILLLLGLFFMSAINGSKSWYIISGIGSFQPSEFMKISLILFNSTIIYKFYKKEKVIPFKKELSLLIIILIIFLIPAVLTFLQPDTGAVIIYFIISFSMLFTSGINKKWFIYISFILIFLFSLFLVLYFFYEDMFIQIFGNSFFYRLDRLINWKNGNGMQLNNSMAAIGSSGIIGHGFNNTPIYFPEAGTDFIFTVYSSNFGLLGSIILIIFFIIFDLYLISISKKVYSIQDKYTLIGIISMLIYQQIQNIGMTIGILPITGITLPFISYGGSSLLSYLLLIGIVINIVSTDKKKKAYK
jgi:rod shape determining protein RodA